MKFLMIFITLISVGCNRNTSFKTVTNQETSILNVYKNLEKNSQGTLIKKGEPGDPLFLCLKFLDINTKNNLLNQPVKFYHASKSGDYEPTDERDESTARLKGTAITDHLGRIF
jgi:hypothetical protein